MAEQSELPSPVVMREFEAVARRATQFAEGLRKANRLPDDFPKMQVEEICKTLAMLPSATTQGGRTQLAYADQRLPDVRGEYFRHDEENTDGQPTRDEGVDEHFQLLIAAVATAIRTIDRESGKRPAAEPHAMRYPVDQNEPSLAATIASGQVAADGLGALGQRLTEITKPESSRADLLRRKVADGRGLVLLARTELMFREVVPQWTRTLGKAIEKIPTGVRLAASAIEITFDLAEPYVDQWDEVQQDLTDLGKKHIRLFIQNLRKNADRLDRIKVKEVSVPSASTAPPPDFDMEKVEALVFAGLAIPTEWVPWVREIRLSKKKRFSNAKPLLGLLNLQALHLSGTGIKDIKPLANLINLQKLSLSRTGITDIVPLAELVNLRELYLAKTSITDAAPLANLVNLQQLALSGTGIINATPLAGLLNLQRLNLSRTGITDAAPLAGLINLQTLYLENTPIMDVSSLAEIPNLSRIYVENEERAKVFLPQLGAGWWVEKPEHGLWYELRRDVPGLEVDD